MEHLAIDLGKRESQLCLRDGQGQILEEGRIDTAEIGKYLARRPRPVRVIVETCSEAFSVADEAMALGHEVRVVPATLARSLGVGEHGIKTDRRDAQALSKASVRMDLGSVHIPSDVARAWKTACGQRDALVRSRTLLMNNARGYLRGERLRVKGSTPASLIKGIRKAFEDRGGVSPSLERVLRSIEQISELIAEADKELLALAEGHPTCRRLMSMPGVGPVTAVRFVATIDDVRRFPNGHRLQSYLGLTPGERSSSDKKRITGITKAGPTALRWVLIQASWSLWRTRPRDPNVLWAMKIAERRGRGIAIVALARKMASILRAMWLSGEEYRVGHSLVPQRKEPAQQDS